MKVMTNELSGAALDWAVAKCEGIKLNEGNTLSNDCDIYAPSTDWAQGGPIIEREQIAIYLSDHKEWTGVDGWNSGTGSTPLTAAMRCYVASKLGDEVEVLEEEWAAMGGEHYRAFIATMPQLPSLWKGESE